MAATRVFCAGVLAVALLAAPAVNLATATEISAELAARLLQGADIELVPMRPLLAAATRLAIALDHPAYDCIYLALAVGRDCRFVTADRALLRKLGEVRPRGLRGRAVSLIEAAG